VGPNGLKLYQLGGKGISLPEKRKEFSLRVEDGKKKRGRTVL